MKNESSDTLITLASWEPRFLEGAKRDIKASGAKEWIFFYFDEFKGLSHENIQAAFEFARGEQIVIRPTKLFYSRPGLTWRKISNTLSRVESKNKLLVDYTTMTREVIWMVLHQLRDHDAGVNTVYWKPAKTPAWTTKNAIRPRLVAGRGGISSYGRPTLLVVVPGFDASRVDQLVCYFEPELTFLFLQSGDQFENRKNNVHKYSEYLHRKRHFSMFEIDAYSADCGLSALRAEIEGFVDTHNIVIGCHGPKPSAIAIDRLQQEFSDLALVYTPALHFNENYSEGIGEPHRMILS